MSVGFVYFLIILLAVIFYMSGGVIYYFLFIMPIIMIQEGWQKLAGFLDGRRLWWAWPYMLLAVFVLLALILMSAGFRY